MRNKRLYILGMAALMAVSTLAQNQGWKKTVFREVDLTKIPNRAMFSPTLQENDGLFSVLLQKAAENSINIYEYAVDGQDRMDGTTQCELGSVLKAFHIPYSEEDGKLSIQERDVPLAEITMYYVKEEHVYNTVNSSFDKQVTALCPVIVRHDEFGEGKSRYPLFWVRYGDIRKFLGDIMVTDSHNGMVSMPLDEWFSLGLYQGELYKDDGQQISSVGDEWRSEEDVAAQRQRIAEDMQNSRKTTYHNHIMK